CYGVLYHNCSRVADHAGTASVIIQLRDPIVFPGCHKSNDPAEIINHNRRYAETD
ncbi:hypothetical protein WA026_015498, partial [Henosepilachna vigintioctopunctata]